MNLHRHMSRVLHRLASRGNRPTARTVGVGTVRAIDSEATGAETATPAARERQILIEVASVQGDTFIGRLVHGDDPEAALLRPGLVVLVAFDPAVREELSLPDDVLAVRASCTMA
jgi:hypothetical protein